jgi:phytoene desaturase
MNMDTRPDKNGKRIVIVGGGPGGLCSAMLLAGRGFEVTVLERRDRVGGRSGGFRLGDYAFDTGSTMLMMRFVAEEMFALAGRRLQDEVSLIPVEPMYRLDFGDRALDMYADTSRMEAELRRFSAGSESGLRRFLQREHERLLRLYPVMQRDWPTLSSLLSPAVLAALPHVGLGRSLHATASDYFEDEALQLGFSFQSAYLGMSPWDCPGGFAMVPYVEHAWGLDHVRGGVHSLCEAMERVALSQGARIRTHADVRHLRTADGRCIGVELSGGEAIPADEVIINADATSALLRLLDGDVSFRFNRGKVSHLQESCSTFMVYLGLDTLLPLAHHTFFFANDYRTEMDRVFHAGALAEDFSLYVCNPSVSDPTMAPPGHSSLYALALVPNTRAGIDWSREAPAMRGRILRTLEARAGVPIERHIRAERHLTPEGWEAGFEVSHGAVFGPAHNISQLLAFRLPNRLPSPSNVYLAGGGTNPGSGLPTILESGRIAARLICEDHGIPFPASRPIPDPLLWPSASNRSTVAAP